MRTRIALMILLAAGAAAAQQSTLTQPTPRVLVESSSQILEVPHFSTMGSPLCDDKGDVFFHVPLTSNSFTDSSVMKLSARSSDPVMFQLSKDLLYKYVFGYFSVTPSGKVGFLDANVEDPAKEGILYVFGFDSDGEMESQVKLDIPEHLSRMVSEFLRVASSFWPGTLVQVRQNLYKEKGSTHFLKSPENSARR